jgi:hypothetical protein
MIDQTLPNAHYRVLKGHPRVHDFVRFVKLRAIDGAQFDEVSLAKEWQEASAYLHELRLVEGRSPDNSKLDPLPSDVLEAAETALRDPVATRCFGFLPRHWSLIDLDQLVIWQKYIDCDFADSLSTRLTGKMGSEELLRIATGQYFEQPEVQIMPLGGNYFSFSSSSSDLRVLGAASLDPQNVQGYQPFGRTSAVLGVFIGYGVNYMLAVHMSNRLLLTNGTHRAYALRALGITHVPCVVIDVSRPEDLDLVDLPGPNEQIEWFFTTERPPLLRDFFDERLYKEITVPPTNHLVRVELKLEQTRAPVAQARHHTDKRLIERMP